MLAALLLVILASGAAAQQYYLYAPKEVTPDEKPGGRDGVLVREVEVERGDTLYGISRRFSGIGSYYPQILLFNEIKNPNLIYTGDVLKVPVSQASPEGKAPAKRRGGKKSAATKRGQTPAAVPASGIGSSTGSAGESGQPTESSTAGQRQEGPSKTRPRQASRKKQDKALRQPLKAASRMAPSPSSPVPAAVPPAPGAGQGLYEQAVKAFRQEDFRTALNLFDRFLTENPASPMAADASLYKAESYLKLSGQ